MIEDILMDFITTRLLYLVAPKLILARAFSELSSDRCDKVSTLGLRWMCIMDDLVCLLQIAVHLKGSQHCGKTSSFAPQRFVLSHDML